MKFIIRAAVAATAALALSACQQADVNQPAVSGAPSSSAEVFAPNLAAALAALPIAPVGTLDDYDRVGDFGESWLDVDNNGCDTRNDILSRDLTDTVIDSDGCVVLSGTLDDPYTAETINFRRGVDTSAAVQIDHVVSLGNAWESGARNLSYDQRIALANDPLNLLAVDGPTNSAKGAGSADEWLPPNGAEWCTYVSLQIQVKTNYSLTISQPEHDAMADVISRCVDPLETTSPSTDAPAPTTSAPVETTPAPLPPVETTEVPLPSATAGDVSYADCTEVRDAGAAPIRAGEPGYSTKLDRDGDGIACE